MKKVLPTLIREKELWRQGISLVGGADEAGRGAWAGPVVASVVILPADHQEIAGVSDSKLVLPKKRQELYHQILNEVIDFGIGVIDNRTIDQIGIGPATNQAFVKAVEKLKNKPDFLLVDAISFEADYPLEAIIKGDQKIYSISCASIVAKVFRDNIMINLDKIYQRYEFFGHKGYGTKKHQKLLSQFGPCDLHRFSYKPIRKLL